MDVLGSSQSTLVFVVVGGCAVNTFPLSAGPAPVSRRLSGIGNAGLGAARVRPRASPETAGPLGEPKPLVRRAIDADESMQVEESRPFLRSRGEAPGRRADSRDMATLLASRA